MSAPSEQATGADLPARWRADRMLLADRRRGTARTVVAEEDALLLMVRVADRSTLLGRGDPARVRRLLGVRATGLGPVRWATLPRLAAGPAGVSGAPEHEGPWLEAEVDLPASTRTALGIEAATAWDWFATTTPPGAVPHGDRVDALDPIGDADAIRACLAAANPGSRADPVAPDEAAWFGVTGTDGLVGVIGASRRAGDPLGADLSWHLHGLGVLPGARGAGLGAALTSAATVAGFAAGADWVSLGMYAANAPARRLYDRLGFVVEGRFTSYRAVTATHPGARR
ncbi:GNAT family N-acetyltransferase [Isoptericola sp. b441]|uniref:GNAT family N-acetyltransferase n=1 Tax=Actinotalea lenta TaxID=3064654 RepID=A0ABT9DA74_9CELL|nr:MULTISPECIES: GNAT family N-acetyltransferase [unclassified Isoptericola]MDO8107809.1 GNAT family N-acetyltransferase [Isoptericola sp. b441]MDO8120520.1 GNAT family N-acetyltransferase [Isoptericola sp. b490]